MNTDISSPLLIYGAGNTGKMLYSALAKRGRPIHTFIDKFSQQRSWNGIPILSKHDAARLDQTTKRNSQVIIAVFNAYHNVPSIEAELRFCGFENIVSFLDVYENYSDELGDIYWLCPKKRYDNAKDLMKQVYNLLSDDESKIVFSSIAQFRISKNYLDLPERHLCRQYMPTNIPIELHRSPMRLIDCGAYTGDTIESFLTSDIKFSAIAAFEPDQENFRGLHARIDSIKAALPSHISLFLCGVSDSIKVANFTDSKGEGSRIEANGRSAIQCVTIDDALPNFNPTFIKMDIEGSEAAALWGARNTLAKAKPALAISLYHKPEDLWHIPLLVKHLCGPGKFYIRMQAFCGFELVLYYAPDV